MGIIWTDRSVKDLHSIFDFISKDSTYYAERFIKSLIKSTEKLENMPFIGREVPEFPEQNFFEIIFKNYRIVYKISFEKQVQILAVVHSARDFFKVIKDI